MANTSLRRCLPLAASMLDVHQGSLAGALNPVERAHTPRSGLTTTTLSPAKARCSPPRPLVAMPSQKFHFQSVGIGAEASNATAGSVRVRVLRRAKLTPLSTNTGLTAF